MSAPTVNLAMADTSKPPAAPDAPTTDDAAAGGASLDNPLRMAQLAYDAGMLIEPEEYSAWTLYSRAAKAQPNNADAAAGLTKVADDLVKRHEVDASPTSESGVMEGVLAKLKSMLWAST